jgi:NitT/TauT family transport system substrate-binding protein
MPILKKLFLFYSLFMVLLLGGCSRNDRGGKQIVIAEQYGLAYAPLQIMKSKGFLEDISNGADVRWVQLGNTAAIRDAALSGHVDAGFLGIPPFLIAYDKGMPWKIASGLSQSPLGLIVNDSLVKAETDFTGGVQLALPQPGSIQHILLSMAMEQKYGDSTMLDKSLVAMKHPDGMNALLSGAVAGHFTSPPYLFQEMDQPGFSLMVSGQEAMGGSFSFIVGMVTDEFYENNPQLYRDFQEALEKSVRFIYENRVESIQILSEIYGLEPQVFSDYFYDRGLVYSTNILGLEKFILFMKDHDMISKSIEVEDILFEDP